MWVSIRESFGSQDPNWRDYMALLEGPQLGAVFTADPKLNPHLSEPAQCSADSLEATLEALLTHPPSPNGVTPFPSAGHYVQVAVDLFEESLPQHPRLQLLGFDLLAEDGTSSLLNAGPWGDELAPFHQRLNGFGLLDEDDAQAAAELLPQAWEEDPQAFVSVWGILRLARGDA